MRKVAIIQARMQSTRLPGKVLKTLGGRTVLSHVVNRVQAARHIDDVVVATSDLDADDAIEQMCASKGWKCVRGSEQDVLSRYALAAKTSKADIVVRVTSDCPLFSPKILDAMLDAFDPENMDYMSTNFPTRSFPVGLDCEIMRVQSLLTAAKEATSDHDREHVTPYLYTNPNLFSAHGFACEQQLENIRITLDTVQDYENLVGIFKNFPQVSDPDSDVIGIAKAYFKTR
jgi:spore coat polysaccharide biosynthesis protein SpsF